MRPCWRETMRRSRAVLAWGIALLSLASSACGGRAVFEDPTAMLIEEAVEIPLRHAEPGSCPFTDIDPFIEGSSVVRSQAELERHCGKDRGPPLPRRLPEVDFPREVALYVGTLYGDGETYRDIRDAWQRADEVIVRLQTHVDDSSCWDCLTLTGGVDLAIMPRPAVPIRFVTIPAH